MQTHTNKIEQRFGVTIDKNSKEAENFLRSIKELIIRNSEVTSIEGKVEVMNIEMQTWKDQIEITMRTTKEDRLKEIAYDKTVEEKQQEERD